MIISHPLLDNIKGPSYYFGMDMADVQSKHPQTRKHNSDKKGVEYNEICQGSIDLEIQKIRGLVLIIADVIVQLGKEE